MEFRVADESVIRNKTTISLGGNLQEQAPSGCCSLQNQLTRAQQIRPSMDVTANLLAYNIVACI